MDVGATLLAATAAAVLGAVLGAVWMAGRQRQQAALALQAERAQAQVEQARLQERLHAASAELELTRQALHDARTQATQQRDELDRARDECARLQAHAEQLAPLQAELRDTRVRAEALQAEVAQLQTRLQEQRAAWDEQLRLLQDARATLTEQFQNLAQRILEDKAQRFTQQNQTNLETLLAPLRQRLADFQQALHDSTHRENAERIALREQVKQLMQLNQQLSTEARHLTQALRGSTKVQGNWGELILERVLEMSGLRRDHEYLVQDTQQRADGSRAQPDVVILLPQQRRLVIDAKVSLLAYERYVNAADDATRQQALREHIESLRAHVRGLAQRDYHALYGHGLDFVLAFMPVEPAFMLAVAHEPDLFQEAWDRNVLLVGPSTLLFVLRTVAHLWRQEAQNRNAQDIARRGGELYDKLVGFTEDFIKVGERLQSAQTSFEQARNKLVQGRGNVIRQAEMLRELGVKPNKALRAELVEAALDGDEAPALPLPPTAATNAEAPRP